jgi:hypothetical protein
MVIGRREDRPMTSVLTGKFWLSVAVTFAIAMAAGYIAHGVLLAADYAALPSVFRPAAEQRGYFGYIVLGQAVFSLAFVWIYQHGREAKPFLAQGLRYGAAIALLATVPVCLVYYAVQPVPPMLPVKQILADGITMLILGAVVAWLNR